jgi:peroxiredoxin
MIDKHDLEFPVFLDPGNEVAQQFGLRYALPKDLQEVYREFGIDLPRFNGDDSWTLPIPARYVIDRNGLIVSCAISADYRDRPDPGETLDLLREM